MRKVLSFLGPFWFPHVSQVFVFLLVFLFAYVFLFVFWI